MESSAHAYSLEQKSDVPSPISVCQCLLSPTPSEEIEVPLRKQKIFSTVSRTEKYLRERRIPELIRFLLVKIIASTPSNPADYGMRLLDDCMIFRSGLGVAPVVYEDRHLQAVVRSFDPSNRGWLSAAQVRRAFTTLGFTPPDNLSDRVPSQDVLDSLKNTQEQELFSLVSAGMDSIDEEIKSVESNK